MVTWGSLVSPSSMWVLGIKYKLSGLATCSHTEPSQLLNDLTHTHIPKKTSLNLFRTTDSNTLPGPLFPEHSWERLPSVPLSLSQDKELKWTTWWVPLPDWAPAGMGEANCKYDWGGVVKNPHKLYWILMLGVRRTKNSDRQAVCFYHKAPRAEWWWMAIHIRIIASLLSSLFFLLLRLIAFKYSVISLILCKEPAQSSTKWWLLQQAAICSLCKCGARTRDKALDRVSPGVRATLWDGVTDLPPV